MFFKQCVYVFMNDFVCFRLVARECYCGTQEFVSGIFKVSSRVPSKVNETGVGFPDRREILLHLTGFSLRPMLLVHDEMSLIRRW